jgi:hypothetical protein
MPIELGYEAVDGVTSQTRQFGAVVDETRTYHEDIDGTIYLDDALDGLTDEFSSSSVRVIGRRKDGRMLVEVQRNLQAFALGQINWTVNTVSMQERTKVDFEGNPIVLEYPPSLDWAIITDGFMSFQYTQYTEQTGEADVYIAAEEITGIRHRVVPNGGIVNHLTEYLRPWKNTINSTDFFGHLRGNVLCLGVDFRQESRRPNGDWICEERYKFITRPGAVLSDDTPGGNGWNTWHYWTDPNSGVIPADALEKKDDGAVKEIQHYPYKDFTVLYLVS